MNNGIVPNTVAQYPSNTLNTRELFGYSSVIRTPFHYPANTNWNLNSNNTSLVFDLSKTFSASSYGTVQTPTKTVVFKALNGTNDRYIFDWGDGYTDIVTTNNLVISHSYPNYGTYTLQVAGNQIGIGTNSSNFSDYRSLVKVISFGSNLTSLSYAFFEAANLVEVPKSLPTNVTNIGSIFYRCSQINDPNISLWDTSKITTMNQAFLQATNFNQDLSNWQTSGVTNMGTMFNSCTNLVGYGLQNWDTRSLTTTNAMFGSCINLNTDLNWNMSGVNDMGNMFLGCSKFNGNLSGCTNVGIISGSTMFQAFSNCPVFLGNGLENWNPSGVTNFQYIFANDSLFNGNLSGWKDAGKITNTNMANMFQSCSAFVGRGLENWNPSATTNMGGMFLNCLNFNTNLSGWNVSNVTDMNNMFLSNGNFIGSGLNNWTLNKVTNLNSAFSSCSKLGSGINLNLSSWNPSACSTFTQTFLSCTNFNPIISGWNLPSGVSLGYTFYGCTNFVGSGLNSWSVRPVSLFLTFVNCNKFDQNLSNWNLDSCINLQATFNGALIFNNGSNSGINNWNTSKVTNMTQTFAGASLFNQPIGGWNTSLVTDMSNMFQGASSFNNGGDAGISGWNTSGVTTMATMFDGASSFNQPIGNWNTSNVTNMSAMFRNANSFNQNLGGWNTTKVTNMANMFFCLNFRGSGLENWNLAGLNSTTSLDNFAIQCNFPSGQYDLILNSWNNNKSIGVNGVANWRTDLRPHFGTSKYTAAGSGARAALISYGWTITDGGLQT